MGFKTSKTEAGVRDGEESGLGLPEIWRSPTKRKAIDVIHISRAVARVVFDIVHVSLLDLE